MAEAAFGTLTGAAQYTAPADAAGTVVLDGETGVPEVLTMTQDGLAIGPLELAAFPNSTIRLKGLAWGQQDLFDFDIFDGQDNGGANNTSDGGSFLSTLAPIGIASIGLQRSDDAPDEDREVGRRDVLKAGAGIVLAANTTSDGFLSGSADSDPVKTVRGKLTQNPSGLKFRISDQVAQYLPPTTTYYGLRDGMDYDEHLPDSADWSYLPPKATGQFSVAVEPGTFDTVKTLVGQKALTYQFELPRRAATYPAGETLTVTANPTIVQAARQGQRTVLTLGDASVPFINEQRTADAGYYTFGKGTLTYHVGPRPPAAARFQLTIFSSLVQEKLDDLEQST